MKRRDFIAALAAAAALPVAADQPTIREPIVHEIQQEFDGKVVWGEDLMRLGLSGTRVGGIETRQR